MVHKLISHKFGHWDLQRCGNPAISILLEPWVIIFFTHDDNLQIGPIHLAQMGASLGINLIIP